jgi:flagellar basal body-associated protein FliL
MGKLKAKKKSAWIIAAVVPVVIIAAVAVIFGRESAENRKIIKSLEGVWIYEDGTKYEFSEDKSGNMYVGSVKYSYTFSVNGDELKMDFDDSAVYDATYSFEVDGDDLKLVGGEGTAGGEYTLSRVD